MLAVEDGVGTCHGGHTSISAVLEQACFPALPCHYKPNTMQVSNLKTERAMDSADDAGELGRHMPCTSTGLCTPATALRDSVFIVSCIMGNADINLDSFDPNSDPNPKLRKWETAMQPDWRWHSLLVYQTDNQLRFRGQVPQSM